MNTPTPPPSAPAATPPVPPSVDDLWAMHSEPDPFVDIVDEPELAHNDLRDRMLQRVKRTHVPLRKILIQQPNTAATRPSLLGEFVNGKKVLPLRALLLIHALEPMLDGTYWTLDVWAKLIGGTTAPQSKERVSIALRWLEEKQLIKLTTAGQTILVTPLHENGKGGDFVRASSVGADVGHGYLTIPTQFWTSGLADQLKLPGLAMFLVCLSETTREPHFQVSLEQMKDWYGISERTAERGYGELRKHGLLLEKTQKVNALNSPTTRTRRVHRALAGPYSTAARTRAHDEFTALLAREAAPSDGASPTTTAPASTS